MVRPSVGYWDPYDFTPIKSPRPARRRLKSERPRHHEASNSLPSDTNPPQRALTSFNPPPSAESDERVAQRFSTARQLRQDEQIQTDDATRSVSPVRERPRRTSRVLGIGELLDSLKQPQAHPAFKEEPVDGDIMDLPERRVPPKKRYNKNRAGAAVASRPTRTYAKRQPQNKSARNNERDEVDASPNGQDSVVVDLTADDDGSLQARTCGTGVAVQYQHAVPSHQAFTAPQRGSQDQIPSTALQQIIEQYRQENIILPIDVTTWHQLEGFAGRNKNPSRVTPAFIAQIRGFYSTLALTPSQGPNLAYPQSSLADQGATQDQVNRNAYLRGDGKYVFGAQHSSSSNTGRPVTGLNTASEVPVKFEHDVQPSPHTNMTGTSVRVVNHNPVLESRLRPQNKDSLQIIGNPSQHRGAGQSQNSFYPPAAKAVDVRPSNALRDLLPPDAPSGHPHLVSIWDPDLLRLSTNQHDHLNLIDTVVSIIAKYDMKDQSAIKGFLDINAVPHFFFLFKSRTSAWHSWSIEREWDTVTVSPLSFQSCQHLCPVTHSISSFPWEREN